MVSFGFIIPISPRLSSFYELTFFSVFVMIALVIWPQGRSQWRRLASDPPGKEVGLMRITFHIGAFTVTIMVKRRNRHSGKWRFLKKLRYPKSWPRAAVAGRPSVIFIISGFLILSSMQQLTIYVDSGRIRLVLMNPTAPDADGRFGLSRKGGSLCRLRSHSIFLDLRSPSA